MNKFLSGMTIPLLALLMVARAAAGEEQQEFKPFDQWALANTLPIRTVEPEGDLSDLRQFRSVIGPARLVTLGEPATGAHEPLAFRNRLFRYLVEELGFTAIAIDTGLPESRRVLEFVTGGRGDAITVVDANLSSGIGKYQENVDLIQWIRTYNMDPAHRRKIRFYGINLSVRGPGGSSHSTLPVEEALSYLTRVDESSARRLQATLQPLLSRLKDGGVASWTSSEQDSLAAAIDDLIALLERGRPAFIAATSEADFEWGLRNAVVARQTDRMFRVLPPEIPGGKAAGTWQAMSAQDIAMAENVRWILNQEGPSGRLLVFAHNAHVMNVRPENGNGVERQPSTMGTYLRTRAGDDMVIIGTSSAKNTGGLPVDPLIPGSIDAALARIGKPRFLLDLRPARSDRLVSAWLSERRKLRSNFTTYLMAPPGSAFDALLFIDALTPAHIVPPQNEGKGSP